MFFGLFGRKQKKEKEQQEEQRRQIAPGVEIYYDPDLVTGLKSDHAELLQLFGKMVEADAAGDYEALPSMLEEFGSMLRGHLLKENIKLYIYLQHALENSPENASLMQGFRSEMNGISKAVTAFLDRYTTDAWEEHHKKSFGAELEAIGNVLAKRIEMEESMLYPLYMPPDAYGKA